MERDITEQWDWISSSQLPDLPGYLWVEGNVERVFAWNVWPALCMYISSTPIFYVSICISSLLNSTARAYSVYNWFYLIVIFIYSLQSRHNNELVFVLQKLNISKPVPMASAYPHNYCHKAGHAQLSMCPAKVSMINQVAGYGQKQTVWWITKRCNALLTAVEFFYWNNAIVHHLQMNNVGDVINHFLRVSNRWQIKWVVITDIGLTIWDRRT